MASVVPEDCIQQVKGLIRTRGFIRALKIIEALLSEHPHSAQLLALKALVYELTEHSVTETLTICSDAEKVLLTDTSALPDAVNTLQIIYQRFKRNDLAMRCYECVRAKFPDRYDLMMGHFCCYVRESSYVNQLKISLQMYKHHQDPKFLLWAVFSIQLQVFYHLLKTHVPAYNFDESEALLLYISVRKEQANYDLAHEILTELGSTLLVAEVGRKCIKGGRLLSRIGDYAAAAEVLRLKFESCGSSDDWECIVKDLTRLLKDKSEWCGATDNHQIYPPTLFVCKLSQLSEGKFDSQMSEIRSSCCIYDARYNSLPGLAEEYMLEKTVYEYFNRFGSNAKVPVQVLTVAEESWLIDNILDRKSLTQNELEIFFEKVDTTFRIIEGCGSIPSGLKSVYHGTIIALKTDKFIIVAADGKFTMGSSYDALSWNADKVMIVDGMGMAVCGDWKNSTKTLGTLSRCMKYLKDEVESRLPVSEFAKCTREKFFSHLRETQVLFCAFDQLEADSHPVPCISYACEFESSDVKELFFCMGTGGAYADKILSSGNVRKDMSKSEATDLVEKALVYANERDGCTGGWASIYVINNDNTVEVMAREHIGTTLWRRHHSFIKGMGKDGGDK